ncbi:MAG: MBL fold metallo-hydrolase [Planctomycetota bacterium]|jgi:glyoxylase-like metal-dependent hydrolase (beta-lactamase superfamily II)/rhodanese-related sulfurtransferase
MILERHYLACLSQASYLIADESTRTAVVIDPRRDVDVYLDSAAAHGVTIRHVLLTHFHADFVSGHLELAKRTGAAIHLGAAAAPDFEHVAMADGDRLELGRLRITALATPGHTPESTTYLLFDLDADPEQPHAAFTGDTLFIGDVGRPDLMASVGITKEELAQALYRSTREKLLTLPDSTLVYPGHGAGSMCGKSLSDAEVSTIGAERSGNPALRELSSSEFVAEITSGQPQAPAYFAHDAAMNKRERATLDEVIDRASRPIAVEAVERALASGVQLVDTRGPEAFAARHVAGSIGIGLDGKFATFAGTVLDLERDIVVLAEKGREREALVRLARVGLDRLLGYVGDTETLFATQATRSVERVDERILSEVGSEAGPRHVLDVRTPGEWADGHLPEAIHVPLAELERRMDEVPPSGRLLVTCRSGYRSSIALGILERAGREDLVELAGGMNSVPADDCVAG